jgi:predicted DNA-binding protein
MASTRKKTFEVQIFTRITKDMDTLLDKLVEEQERSKSFILRKALENYLQINRIS